MSEITPTDQKHPLTPPPDVDGASSLLRSMSQVVAENKAPAGGGKTWLWGIALFVIALIAGAVWVWVSRRHLRELADLRHDKERARILQEKSVVDKAVEAGDKRILDLRNEYAEASRDIERLNLEIRTVEARRAADQLSIDRIRSWRDVDPGFPQDSGGR